MNTVSDFDTDTVYKLRGSKTIHLNEDCQSILAVERDPSKVSAVGVPDKPVCLHCDPHHDPQRPAGENTANCMSCGSVLDVNGECGFCERFECVLGDVPSPSEYSDPMAFVSMAVKQSNARR